MNGVQVERLSPLVKDEAKRQADRTPGVDADDVEQAIWLSFVERWKFLEPHIGGENVKWDYAQQAAQQTARTYCDNERYRYEFFSSQYVYTPDEIRALFKDAYFVPANWEQVPTKQQDGIILLWDLQSALTATKDRYREAIIAYYRDGEDFTKSQMRTVQRAIDDVTRRLNRHIVTKCRVLPENEGPGTRKIVSNAQSQSFTYEGY